jgi:chemotaxis protein MotB
VALADPTQSGEGAAAAIPAPIIVKKITIQAAGHHGGAWKVAYADIITAIMEYFMLMR